ncbi:MAG TPA: polyketide synthase, partial [Pyrinomonadaceae bacterium]
MSSQFDQSYDSAIAIIGMGLRFPGARTIGEYWANLRGGVESISELSAEELEQAGVTKAEKEDPQYVKRVPLKPAEVESFDAQFFGFSPREAMLTDPQQRVLLETAWEALENAGYDVERYAGEIGVWAGAGVNRYLLENLLPEREWLDQEVGGLQVWLGNEKDFLSTRVSYKLNLHGPSMSVNTACSTSLVAVHLACQSL